MLPKDVQQQLTAQGRDFMKGYRENDPYMEDFQSDQTLRLPQPPLCKAPMRGEAAQTALPMHFGELPMGDFLSLIQKRKSRRIYTDEPITLLQLSFLLWASQGIKGRRGRAYATLRTVPSGGARHEYETYIAVRKVEGLAPGIYHYLPELNAVELLRAAEDPAPEIVESLSGQKWAGKASAVFYWAMDAYRAEWRYGIYAHRVALIDAGHIGQNLTLAAEAMGLGSCAVAAIEHEVCCRMLEIDGEKEFAVYAMPAGTVDPEKDAAAEQDIYRFVREQNL